MGKLTEAIRTNRPTTWDPDRQSSLFDGEDPRLLAVFWEAMHSLSTFTARTLGQAIDLSAARGLLDVGGGSAAFDIELCRLYRDLTATVSELPKVAGIVSGRRPWLPARRPATGIRRPAGRMPRVGPATSTASSSSPK